MTGDEAAANVADTIDSLLNKIRWCLMNDRPTEAETYGEAVAHLASAHWNLVGDGED